MKSIIFGLFLLVPLAAQAQLLKCVGAGGKIEYASQCPQGTQEIQTGIKNQPGKISSKPAASATQKSLAERDAEFRKRQQENAEAAAKQEKQAEQLAQQKRACQDARNYLTGLEAGARITRIDPKTGERVFLDDNARVQETARARESVSANCK